MAVGEVSDRGHDFRIGAAIEIMRPDGSRIVSAVRGVDTFTKCFTERARIGILLDEVLAKEDVPPGSVITVAPA